jgi:hypothetical protein
MLTPGFKKVIASDYIGFRHFLRKPHVRFVRNVVINKLLISIPRNYGKGRFVAPFYYLRLKCSTSLFLKKKFFSLTGGIEGVP